MRVAPIGFLTGRSAAVDVFRIGAEAAALTHGHPSGYLSAGTMAAIISQLMDGVDLRAAVDQAATILCKWEFHEETLKAIQQALYLAGARTKDADDAVASLGEGWVGEEALAIGLFAALSATRYAEALAIAANHDGDSDSTASIAGQLWGAWKGLDGIPHDWIVPLDIFRPALRLAAGDAPAS